MSEPKNDLDQARAELAREAARSAREGGGLPTEADDAVNNASRRVVDAVHAAHGQAWLGQINLYGEDRGMADRVLRRWDESPVLNFEAAFVVPGYDDELVRLIIERDVAPYTSMAADVPRVDAITQRIAELGGALLIWT